MLCHLYSEYTFAWWQETQSTDVHICDSYLTCIHLIKILTEYVKVSAVFLKCSVKERKFSDDYIQLDFHFQEISIFF